jgi:NitT/TauT family transport system substrate-binding protein
MRPIPFLRSATIVTAIAGLILGASSARADAPALTTIRIADAGQDIDAQGFYGEELGIFKKYGIHAEVTILRKGGGSAAITALLGGAVDVAEGDIVSLATAHVKGLPIVLIAPSGVFHASTPTTEVVVAKNSPIESPKDLEGKTVALISLEGPSRIATNEWLVRGGASLDKVSFIELPPVNMAAAVDRGIVAAAVINEPSLTASQSCCRVLGNNFASIANVWQLSGWYTTTDYATKNPDLVKRFALALRETAQWANKPENHARSGEILNTYTQFPADLLVKMNRTIYGETLDPKTMQPILDAALKYKALPSAVAAQTLISPLALTQ